MTGVALCVLVSLSAGAVNAADAKDVSDVPTVVSTEPSRGVGLGDVSQRSMTLLGGEELAATWMPSKHSPMQLTDGLRFASGEGPQPLDTGGGLSSDLRQILALILGFIPGFGIGHLIARDKDGFILFLIIDVVLWVLGAVTYGIFWHGVGWGWGIGGVVWLVVHIIQALDAYSSAGGGSLVQNMRERNIDVASKSGAGGHEQPFAATRLFGFAF